MAVLYAFRARKTHFLSTANKAEAQEHVGQSAHSSFACLRHCDRASSYLAESVALNAVMAASDVNQATSNKVCLIPCHF